MNGTLEEKVRVLALAGAIGTMSVLTACSYDSSKGGSYRIEAGGSVSGKIYVEVSEGNRCDHRHEPAHRKHGHPSKTPAHKSRRCPATKPAPQAQNRIPFYSSGQNDVGQTVQSIAVYPAPGSDGYAGFSGIRFENPAPQQRITAGTSYYNGAAGPFIGLNFCGRGSPGPIPGTNYRAPVPCTPAPPRPVNRGGCQTFYSR